MKGMTLNDVAERKVQWLGFAFAVISAIAFFVLTLCTPALAEGTFIGEGAQKLLTDFAKVIALVGVGAGIFQVVKGRTVMGIVVAVVAAILYFFCAHPDKLGGIGEKIVGIFF